LSGNIAENDFSKFLSPVLPLHCSECVVKKKSRSGKMWEPDGANQASTADILILISVLGDEAFYEGAV
jgi:hypothetical protein